MTVTEKRVARIEQRLEELVETMDVISDKRLARSIERGLRDLREGRYKKYADVNAMFRDIERSS